MSNLFEASEENAYVDQLQEETKEPWVEQEYCSLQVHVLLHTQAAPNLAANRPRIS
jgi:hypothetical protein